MCVNEGRAASIFKDIDVVFIFHLIVPMLRTRNDIYTSLKHSYCRLKSKRVMRTYLEHHYICDSTNDEREASEFAQTTLHKTNKRQFFMAFCLKPHNYSTSIFYWSSYSFFLLKKTLHELQFPDSTFSDSFFEKREWGIIVTFSINFVLSAFKCIYPLYPGYLHFIQILFLYPPP